MSQLQRTPITLILSTIKKAKDDITSDVDPEEIDEIQQAIDTSNFVLLKQLLEEQIQNEPEPSQYDKFLELTAKYTIPEVVLKDISKGFEEPELSPEEEREYEQIMKEIDELAVQSKNKQVFKRAIIQTLKRLK